MPIESIVVVGLVIGYFSVFALTLAWAKWYTGSTPVEPAPKPAG